MDFMQLHSFVTVVECCSFSCAAQKLHMAHSTITGHVQRLEQELNCTLIKRSTRTMTITDKGQSVYRFAKHALGGQAELLADLKRLDSSHRINQNSPIFADAKAREAVCLALNFDEIIAGAYGSEKLAKPATGTVICAGEAYFTENVPNYQQDVARAAQLAKESGLDQQTLRLTYNTGRANMENVALIIQQQLAAAGIKAEVIGKDSSTHLAELFFSEEGWDIGLNGYASDGKADYCSWYKKGSYYSLNTYTTDELNAMWTAADMAMEGQEAMYEEISRVLQGYFTFVPVSSTNKVVVTPANTHGWDATARGDLSDYTVLYKTK